MDFIDISPRTLSGETIPNYCQVRNIRDWLYVTDHCQGMIFHHGRKGQIYNIGGRNEWQNIDIARLMCRFLDSKAPRTEGKNYAEQI